MPKKILLADDSLTIQKVVELTFSDSDFDLVCVGNGLRALEKVREDRPDLILADVVMPEKNGYEVCEAIKGDPATSRIPVILLTGTFEPFDRLRAERIGADAIVSKPFDSQQLLRQVEALLARAGSAAAAAPSTVTMALRIPEEISLGAGSPPGRGQEPEPFDAGFTPEDFSGSIRVPTGDPFEEEYGQGDVDSAIEAFEKAETGTEAPAAPVRPEAAVTSFEEEIEESSWLVEEPERQTGPERSHWMTPEMPPAPALFGAEASSEPARRAEDEPTAEIEPGRYDMRPTEPFPAPAARVEEISAQAAEVLFDVPEPAAEPAPAEPESEAAPAAPEEPAPAPAAGAPAPPELEELAQTSSIPELAQMLSSVSRAADLSDADIDRLAARVVEKLSDRVIREIAWEVIPDMAEIVIKQRIKELEAGIE